MATYTSLQISNGLPVTQPPGGVVAFQRGRVSVTSNIALNDVLEFVKLPKGAIVCGMRFFGDELDTNATAEIHLDFGNTTNAAAYGVLDDYDASANPQGSWLLGLVQDADAVATTQEETVQATVTVAAATATTGDVYLDVYYTMELTNT